MEDKEPKVFIDRYGIVELFATHLELSLEAMNPQQAFESAQHSTRAYINSYDFIPIGVKGSTNSFHMAPKKPNRG
jgi:uncharacterized membrane-anchored protein